MHLLGKYLLIKKNKMKKFIIVAIYLLMGINGMQSQSIPVFKEGERVAFVGNSITCGGHYHSYIWLYYMTHFPNRRIDVFNEGVGGDVAKQMSQRLDKVFEHNPHCGYSFVRHE